MIYPRELSFVKYLSLLPSELKTEGPLSFPLLPTCLLKNSKKEIYAMFGFTWHQSGVLTGPGPSGNPEVSGLS